MKTGPNRKGRRITGIALTLALAAGGLVWGTWRDPDFWSTPAQRGDRLMKQGRFAEAARMYRDPLSQGVALYRDGQFEAAAQTFARVSGDTGAYDAGNAWLMHGQYDRAIACFNRALKLRPGWREAQDNRAVAIARRERLQVAGKDRAEESADAYDPDHIVFDAHGASHPADPQKPLTLETEDAALQATWLRRVKTTPAQFLKAKFAWQAQNAPTP